VGLCFSVYIDMCVYKIQIYIIVQSCIHISMAVWMGAIAWIQAAKNINTTDKSFSLILFQQKTTVGLDLS